MGIYACAVCGNPNGWWSGNMQDIHVCPGPPAVNSEEEFRRLHLCEWSVDMASTNVMLQSCSGMLETNDLNDWEHQFVESVWERSEQGKRPDLLSPKQVEKLEQLYRKHFA